MTQAKGVAAADSDYDFLVVVPHSEKPRYQRDQEAYLMLCGSGVAKDVIVLTREEFESSQRAEIAPHLESALRGAYFLTTFASGFRYPGDVTEPGAEEANTDLAIASEVVEVSVSCLDRIP
jgi:hypothetical protein